MKLIIKGRVYEKGRVGWDFWAFHKGPGIVTGLPKDTAEDVLDALGVAMEALRELSGDEPLEWRYVWRVATAAIKEIENG